MEPKLSQYTQFFVSINKLYQEEFITKQERDFLKTKLLSHEKKLIGIVCQYQKGMEQQFQKQLLDYQPDPSIQAVKLEKQRTSRFSSSARQIFYTDNRDLPHHISLQMETLVQNMNTHLENDGKFSITDQDKMRKLRNILNQALGENQGEFEDSPNRGRNISIAQRKETEEQSETSLMMEDKSSIIIKNVQAIYKELKMVFAGNLHTHLLLMQEEITYNCLFSVVKAMIKTLVDADDLTFFIRTKGDWAVYSTEEDSIQQISKEQEYDFIQHFEHLKPNQIYTYQDKDKEQKYLQKFLSKFKSTSMLRFATSGSKSEVIFMFQWRVDNLDKLQRKFIYQANEYGFRDEVIALADFLVDVIMQARVKYFNPLQFADKIQDLALSFVGISRYILVDSIKKTLEINYKVTKDQTFSEDGVESRHDEKKVTIEMRCQNPVTLTILNMNLQNVNERMVYTEIIRIKDKYESYLRSCHEKTAYYKYFIRSSDSIVFDFDQNGKLIFLSHPIWQILKDKYGVQYDTQWKSPKYQDIFTDKKISDLINIEAFKQKKRNEYLQHEEFEIFLKVVDEDFKGFVIIFHLQDGKRIKDYIKNLKPDEQLENEIQQTIRRSVNKHQTFKFLNQLEQSNPGVKNSYISLFIPEDSSTGSIESQQQKSQQRKQRISISVLQKDIRPFQQHLNMTIKSIESSSNEDYSSDDDPRDEVNKLQFNILEYTSSQSKQKVIHAIIAQNGWIEMFDIHKMKLQSMIRELERKYNKRNNPFHNFDHGISVMQSCHYLTSLPAASIIDDLVHFATVISGLCHDVSHTGRANQFEINSRSKLAIRYHDKSPLENYHAASSMKMMQKAQFNILENLNDSDLATFRQVFIENILYTDIKQHFSLLKDFETRIREFNQDKKFGLVEGDIKLLTGMIVHTADFSGGAKTFEISRKWSDRVNLEFTAQYNEEGRLGIQQTPFLKDLDNIVVMAKSEMGFFKVIVRPLWALLNEYYQNDLQENIDNLDNTIISWEKVYHANLQF